MPKSQSSKGGRAFYSIYSGGRGNDSDYFHLYGFLTHSALCDRVIKHYNLGFQICKIQIHLFLIAEKNHLWCNSQLTAPHLFSLDAGNGTELLQTWSILCLLMSCCLPGSTKHLISLIFILALLSTFSFHSISIFCRKYKSRNLECQHRLKTWQWQLLQKTFGWKMMIRALLEQKCLW